MQERVTSEARPRNAGERLMTLSELATYLHIHPTTIRRWTNEGLLTCFRIGGRRERRFLWRDVASYLEEHAYAGRRGRPPKTTDTSSRSSVEQGGLAS